MCTIEPDHGDSLVHLGEIKSTETIALPETTSWFNNYTVTEGTSCSVDGEFFPILLWGFMNIAKEDIGAKRDREVW